MRSRLATFVLLFAMTVPAMAANEKVLQFDDIRSQQAQIRADVEAGTGRYKSMPAETRVELLRRQNEVLTTIEGKQIPSDLNQDQRTKVFNNLEWIEAAINNTESERLICERVATIGSTLKKRVCKTAAQVEEERERARKELDTKNYQMTR